MKSFLSLLTIMQYLVVMSKVGEGLEFNRHIDRLTQWRHRTFLDYISVLIMASKHHEKLTCWWKL